MIYGIGLVAPFALTLLALLVKANTIGNYLLGIMSAMGGIVAIYVFLGIGSDGDLTHTTSTGTLVQDASATINLMTWNFITYLTMIFALFAFMAALYKVWGAGK